MNQPSANPSLAAPSSTWNELLDRSRAGCPEAFEKIVSQVHDYLILVASDQIGSGMQTKFGASDIVQSGLMRAYGSIRSFNGSSEIEFRAWVRKIVLNTLSKQSRRYLSQKRLVAREQELEDFHLSIQSTASHEVASAEQRQLLRGFIAELSPTEQRVIEMRNRYSFTFAKIAEILGSNEAKIRRINSAAFEKLKARFEQQNDKLNVGS